MNVFIKIRFFHDYKRMGPLGPIVLESDWPYFEIMGQ